jgi:predicted nucleic acid-binding protein
MRVLVDTNVFLDVLLNREEWVENSQAVLNRLERVPGSGWIAWHTLSNLYYIGRKLVGEKETRQTLRRLLASFSVCPAGGEAAVAALDLPLNDLEDALQVVAGQAAKVEWIITRNTADFANSPLPAISPQEALQRVLPQ